MSNSSISIWQRQISIPVACALKATLAPYSPYIEIYSYLPLSPTSSTYLITSRTPRRLQMLFLWPARNHSAPGVFQVVFTLPMSIQAADVADIISFQAGLTVRLVVIVVMAIPDGGRWCSNCDLTSGVVKVSEWMEMGMTVGGRGAGS